MARALSTAALLPLAGALTAGRMEVTTGANPVRKVVNLLQKMQKKVQEEADEAEELYKKFICYCKTSGGDLTASIEAAEAKIPELSAELEEMTSRKSQLEADLKSHQKDRSAAKKAIADATALRKKEKEAFDKASAEGSQNLKATQGAIAAISEGMGGSFLQSASAGALRRFVSTKQDLNEADRRDVLAFLSAQQGSEYAPASGEIVGILKQMAEEMEGDLKSLTETEQAAIKSFEETTAAKKKEIEALSASIESKMTRVGELGVEIATMENDAEDTAESLAADKKFVAELKTNCGKKTGTHEKDQQMRAEEVTAIADTIKILNDDDALDLFKKTLPSASSSFLQIQESSASRRATAGQALAELRGRVQSEHRPNLDFILLAISGKKAGFGKIVKMVDNLVATLKSEQGDDDDKKEYCAAQFDQTEDKITGLKNKISDSTTAREEAKESRTKLMQEIAALKTGIVALDKATATATANRETETAEYKDLVKSDSAAKELLLFAKNRLNKFYNPKLYKAPPKRQLSEGDQIYENEGGDIPQAAAGGIAGTGISAFAQVSSDREAPPPPPATAKAYKKSSSGSNGVIAMIDLLVKDLDKELQQAEVEEKNSQAEYEQTMTDSAEKRVTDSKGLTDKEAAAAEMEAFLEKNAADAKALGKELMGTDKYMSNLHGECDWLVKNFEARKQARGDEIDSLERAKAVLSGADYSFVQQGSTRAIRRV